MINIKINGKRIRNYTHDGNTFIEGRQGTEYSVELKNIFSTRKLFVVSIDGINVISGKPATEDPYNGYIINGFDSLDLKGFRVNNEDVAAFKFVKSDDSYANGITNDKINNGVIGVKVYDEKIVTITTTANHWPYQTYTTSFLNSNFNDGNSSINLSSTTQLSQTSPTNLSSTVSNNTASGYYGGGTNGISVVYPAEFNLGTGWGTKQTQPVKEVSFEIGNLLSTHIIYYASKSQLEKMGIDMGTKTKIRSTMPSAFGEQKKFCPVPKNWKG